MRVLIPIAPVAAAAFVQDDASALVQLVTHRVADDEIAPDQQACACEKPDNNCLPDDFTDWEFCDSQYTTSLAEDGKSPQASGRKDGYKITHDLAGKKQFKSDGKKEVDITASHQEMRFFKVAEDRITKEVLDMVVTVDEGSTYMAYNCKDNGKPKQDVGSCFGQINVLTDTSAVFNFQFQNQDGAPHKLKNFMFTIYDVDQQGTDDHEFVEFMDTPTTYWTSNETDGKDVNPSQIDKIEPFLKFQSTGKGDAKDNPSRMGQLSPNHPLKRSKTISVQYNNRDSFKVKFGHVSKASKGRKFLFGGRVPTFGCPNSSSPTPPPPAPVCPDWTPATFDWDVCASGGPTQLPSRNNLGGLGPNTADAKEIRYDKVANYGGKDLDLVVTNSTPYSAYNITRNLLMDGSSINGVGVHGCYGVVNVNHSSSVTLDFAFKYHGQDDGPTFTDADKFVFSLWDIDRSNEPGNQEKIIISNDHIEGALKNGDKVSVSSANNQFVISSTAFGNGSDNPADELVSSLDLASKRVAMLYKGTSTWQVTFEAVAGAGGRNFMFYGCRV